MMITKTRKVLKWENRNCADAHYLLVVQSSEGTNTRFTNPVLGNFHHSKSP